MTNESVNVGTGRSSAAAIELDSLGADFDDLLRIARDLRERVEAANRRSDMMMMYASLFFVMSVASLLWALSLQLQDFTRSVAFGLAGLLLIYVILSLLFASRIRRRAWSDRLALRRVVAIIGETLQAAATREGWGPVKRAKYEISLASLSVAE
jgi:hypothetical protein